MTAEVAISHCAHQVDWLTSIFDAINASTLRLTRVTVYLKCNRDASAKQLIEQDVAAALKGKARSSIQVLPNVGRCDHTWAYHLERHYTTLADVVIFLKDSTYSNWNTELRRLILKPRIVVEYVKRSGYGCFRRPDVHGPAGGRLHMRAQTMRIRRSTYSARDAKYSTLNHSVQLQAFSSGLNMTDFASRALDPWFFSKLMRQTFIPVCYGGSFAFIGADARIHSRDSFRRLRVLLSRADNLEEGHYMERLWHAVLQPEPAAVNADEIKAVLQGVGNNIASRRYLGMATRCCCEMITAAL